MIITKKHISRRTVLRGMGVTLALPFLDAMVPAGTAEAKTAAAGKIRFSAIEQVHGSAGATKIGLEKNLWSPAATGRAFDLTPTSLSPLEPYRDYLTIVSNTDVRNAEAFLPKEIGGDHFRSSAVFLTQAHPKQTEGSDVLVGPSIDQLYAQKFGQDTAIPSMQLAIENVDQAGGCAYGYACVYTDTISWADAETPLPMIRDPRYAFDQLFGVGATPQERAARRATDKNILDWMTTEVSRLRNTLGPSDRARLESYLEDINEIERRIKRIEAQNSSGEHARAARRAGGRARLVLRAREADVRLAGAGVCRRHHPRVLVQDRLATVRRACIRRAASTCRSTRRRITASARSACCSSRRSTSTTSACCPTSSTS